MTRIPPADQGSKRNGDPEAGAWLDSSSSRSVEFREGRAFLFVLLYEHAVLVKTGMQGVVLRHSREWNETKNAPQTKSFRTRSSKCTIGSLRPDFSPVPHRGSLVPVNVQREGFSVSGNPRFQFPSSSNVFFRLRRLAHLCGRFSFSTDQNPKSSGD